MTLTDAGAIIAVLDADDVGHAAGGSALLVVEP